jgi:pantoate--beta-alanine ligase
METIRVPGIMKETSKRLRTQGKSIGLVPTMGSLHDGHMFLVKRAKMDNDIVAVSIFVNPAQFGRNEDLDNYPRDIDGDMEKLAAAGVDILLAPEVSAIYPEGYATYIEVRGISDKLCGAFRPGHFTGVATVVNKLLNMVIPTRAYFGLKDFQQARVIEKMISDLNMNVEFVGCATVRESDGLAMSSRNRYLAPDQRSAATIIYTTLNAAAGMVRAGAPPAEVKRFMNKNLKSEPLVSEIQYAGVYDPDTLEDRIPAGKKSLLAAAVRMGRTRLIDNLLVEA